jgi:succinate dehydrogenase / fumarate reductase, cytochrome b subunit
MKDFSGRPVFLTLWQIHFPYSALASIAHRLSGLLMAVFVPLLVWLLGCSLHSEGSFQLLQTALQHNFYIKFVAWSFLVALTYHIYSGIRHLLLDLDFFKSKSLGQKSAQTLFALVIITIFIFSLYFWRISL